MYGFVFGTQIVKKRIGRNGHTSKLKREIEKNFGNQTSVIFSAEELDVLGREQGEESWDLLSQALGTAKNATRIVITYHHFHEKIVLIYHERIVKTHLKN